MKKNTFCAVSPLNVASTTESQALTVVAAGLNGAAPVAVRDIPFDSLAQAAVERARGSPAKLSPDLRRVNRITPVVAWTIGHEGLQRAIRRARRLRLVERLVISVGSPYV